VGPFEVRTDGGGSAGVPGARLRGLLIALALKPGHAIPKAALVDWIWGEQPPADAANALQRLVSRLRKALPDGVIEGRTDGYRLLVEPDAVGADGDLAQAALAGLGPRDALLGESPNAEPADRLISAIRERETLLILDNCEHLIESAAEFAHRVLGECRRLRILATSREPLGITGEALWLVEPLALPDAHPGRAEMEASPAVRLLRDRAGAVRRDLAVDARTLPTMVRIRRALDGMPLAIELAAASLRTMSIDQLAHRLDDRFRLLTSGSRTALPRHKALRAVVDWSWELLTDAERTVLRRLSAFSGGASPEAAERVCAGGGVEREQVFELLTALTEKSLLLAAGDAAARYRMLGTIKEYAGHRLAEAGESDLARHAHPAYFTELAETAEPHLRRAEQLEWLAAVGAEHDNIGAAMRGVLAAGEAHAAMRLAAGAGWYWWLSGQKTEGMELTVAAAEAPGEVPDGIRATAYALITMFASSGPGDEHQIAEWIHKAYRFSRLGQSHHPLIGFAVPLERMLEAPDAALPAFESLLADKDPWARALARLHLGKMRILRRPRRRVESAQVGEPEPDVGAGDLALEFLGGALGDQTAVVEHRDPAGESAGFLQVLGGEEDGGALGRQLADDRPHRAPAARVQSRCRLVQEDDLRVADQRHRQVQLPAHTAGVGRRQLVRRFHQVEPLQQPRDQLAAGTHALQVRHQPQVLPARQQFVHRGELTGHADGRAYLLGRGRHVVPGDAHRPGVGFHQRRQDVHRGRLARAVRAEDGKDRSRGDVEVDAVEHDFVPVHLPQPGDRDCRIPHAPTVPTRSVTRLPRPCHGH
jgi:predicted ATPase